MTRSLFPLLLSALLWGHAQGEEPVQFVDARLKAAVEDALWVTDPTPDDMLGLTTLNCTLNRSERDEGLIDLTGLEYATNLETLHLRANQISNISALAGLTNLQTLDLSQNYISDLSPLSGLDRVTYLNLHANRISDISALSGLKNLETLIVRLNEITDISALAGVTSLRNLDLGLNLIQDISPLSGLSGLSTLRLWCNQVRDLTPLSGMTNLEVLDLSANRISDVSPLARLSHLSNLDLESNLIGDISPLSGLTSLSRLDLVNNGLNEEAFETHIPEIIANNPGIDLSYDLPICHLLISSTAGGTVIRPGEGEFACDNGETVHLEAKADPCCVFVTWAGGLSDATNPTALVVREDLDIKAVFASTLDVVYVDDDAPDDPWPEDSAGSDPNENGTRQHPFDMIQEAIEVGTNGATVVVRPGTYQENINLLGKSIQLTGINPNEVALPVIDGAGTGPVVSFTRGEDPNCMLVGFVLMAGQGQEVGAIACSGSSPTVANCLIVGNRSFYPNGAAVCCRDSQASFRNCTIADNAGGLQGAGIMLIDSHIGLTNSILWGNAPDEIVLRGDSVASITYTNIAGGWPDAGNIKADPLFARHGHWVDPIDLETGARPDNPNAIWVAGDYHLKSQAGRWDPEAETWVYDDATSPCIDGGNPSNPVGSEPVPNGGVINMGAYGGTTEASIGW